MSDLISRQAAIDAVEIMPFDDYGDYMRARELIEELPSAEPVRHGKWIEEHCSECGQYVYHGDALNYCPNCGANMRTKND